MTQSRSRHLVDPDLLPLLDMFPTVALDTASLAELRAMESTMAPPVDAEGTTVEEYVAPGLDGGPPVTLRVYRPANPTEQVAGCIYHVHGGGYVGGSARQYEFLVRPLARELDCVVVAVEYRLAPENPHPAPILDCYAGLAWVFANAEKLGLDVARIGIMGESAGGGLAAALALMARDRGEFAPAFQVLTYPMLDDRTCVRETLPHVGEFVWTPHNNRFGWASLLGREPGGADVPVYAAAARASQLRGLPPTYMDTGSLDLFLEENLAYAHRLGVAGVALELHVWPGAFHGFELAGDAPVAVAARARKLAALRRFLDA